MMIPGPILQPSAYVAILGKMSFRKALLQGSDIANRIDAA